jgi:hypothetical protein
VGVLYVLGDPLPVFEPLHLAWADDPREEERQVREADWALRAAGVRRWVRRARTAEEKERFGTLVYVSKIGRGALWVGGVILS